MKEFRDAKQFDDRLNKTYKNKSGFKKCDTFCKKNYIKNSYRVLKKSAKRFNIPYEKPTKGMTDFMYHGCKKSFCNEQCEGYENVIGKVFKPGFHKNYTKKKVVEMKKKGLLSGCSFDLELI